MYITVRKLVHPSLFTFTDSLASDKTTSDSSSSSMNNNNKKLIDTKQTYRKCHEDDKQQLTKERVCVYELIF